MSKISPCGTQEMDSKHGLWISGREVRFSSFFNWTNPLRCYTRLCLLQGARAVFNGCTSVCGGFLLCSCGIGVWSGQVVWLSGESRKEAYPQESQQVQPEAIAGRVERREAAPARFPAGKSLPRNRLCQLRLASAATSYSKSGSPKGPKPEN